MTFVPLDIPPGVIKTRSGEGAAGRWNDANNIRFVAGKPRKRAGFEQLNTELMLGFARGMEAWNKSNGGPLYAVGTNLKVYGSVDGEDVIDITPLRALQSWSSKLSTTVNLGAVSVRMVAHGYALGKLFKIFGNSFQGGSAVGGVALNGVWELVSVTDADNFKIYPASPAGTLANNPFAATNLSPTVTVTHAAHGRATGDSVWFSGATASNGITIAGDYKITVVNANSYTIVHSGAASSSGSGGGAAVAYRYSVAATSSVALGGGVVPYFMYLANPFTTTNLSAVVTVAHTAHGAGAHDVIHISGATAVGGITIAGDYEITTLLGADSYTITHTSAATSGATGGGTAVLLEYEITTGPASKIPFLRGFGTGPLGSGFFGGAGPAVTATYYDPRTWAIDSAGEDAILSHTGGTIYYWDSSAAGRADAIPGAPTDLRHAFMTDERHLHALGKNGDPMVMAWASQDAVSDWIVTTTNTANSSRRVREGSKLVAGAAVGDGVNLIWTDTAVYTHQYTGSRFIYDTRLDKKEAGLISAQAFAVTPVGVLWMSQTRFKMWGGSTMDVPNAGDVQTWVYDNLDRDQQGKCLAHYDALNNSVDFYFVPLGGAEPSLYVTVNLDDWTWVNGEQTRTTGATFQAGQKAPLRVLEGKVYRHEVGVDADGASAPSHLSLAPYEVNKKWQEILGFDPDFKLQTGDVEIEYATYDRSSLNVVDSGSETAAVGDEIVDMRGEGRRIALTISQDVLGGDWSMDVPQVDIKTSGKKR